jgi:23S rRNA pseudouridine1911/1915/1917 synthase
MPSLDVLYEDNHLLVVNKPAGIPTQGAAVGEDSLVNRAKDYLAEKYAKPGNVYLGVVSRLDALVTGVVVFARTSKAAARLNEQFREAEVAKTYWAIVEGKPKSSSERLVNWIRKDDRRHRMVVVPRPQQSLPADSQEARLSYRVLRQLAAGKTLLEVTLETGRKHQIRLQLAHSGLPILGDTKYGAGLSFGDGIALHARRLEILHPTQKSKLCFHAPLPASWRKVGIDQAAVKELEKNPP